MGHTKLPWILGWGEGLTGPTTPAVDSPVCGGHDWPFQVISKGKHTIAICPAQPPKDWMAGPFSPVPGTDKANAAFIVKACNNHEKLIEALEDIILDQDHGRITRASINKAQAALAAAKEE